MIDVAIKKNATVGRAEAADPLGPALAIYTIGAEENPDRMGGIAIDFNKWS